MYIMYICMYIICSKFYGKVIFPINHYTYWYETPFCILLTFSPSALHPPPPPPPPPEHNNLKYRVGSAHPHI